MRLPLWISALPLIASGASVAQIVTFEDLNLAPNSFYNGADGAGRFTSGPATFLNSYTDFGAFSVWEGWSYSNQTDTTTPGFLNQYSAITGSGVESSTYGVSFAASPSRVEFNVPTAVAGAFFTNTTYAFLSMLNGDAFARKFEDGDWFKLTITGKNAVGTNTGSVDYFLADLRFADAAQDYISNAWEWVSLLDLGEVSALEFTMDSSNVGPFGINNPTYFAMDDLRTVPLPGALGLWLIGLALTGISGFRQRTGNALACGGSHGMWRRSGV